MDLQPMRISARGLGCVCAIAALWCLSGALFADKMSTPEENSWRATVNSGVEFVQVHLIDTDKKFKEAVDRRDKLRSLLQKLDEDVRAIEDKEKRKKAVEQARPVAKELQDAEKDLVKRQLDYLDMKLPRPMFLDRFSLAKKRVDLGLVPLNKDKKEELLKAAIEKISVGQQVLDKDYAVSLAERDQLTGRRKTLEESAQVAKDKKNKDDLTQSIQDLDDQLKKVEEDIKKRQAEFVRQRIVEVTIQHAKPSNIESLMREYLPAPVEKEKPKQ